MTSTNAGYEAMDVETSNMSNKKNIRKGRFVSFILGFLISALLFGVIMVIYTETNKLGKSECPDQYVTTSTCSDEHRNAINQIHLKLLNSTLINSSTMSDSDKFILENAYKSFDSNNDGLWSYDEHLLYAQCLSNHSKLFNIIDFDDDAIISIREFVSYLMNIHGVTKDMMTMGLDEYINDIYDFDEGINTNNTQIRSQLYHEYVADIWFATFDELNKGYINFTDWQYWHYDESFYLFDRNNDSLISFDEFMKQQFHLDEVNTASEAFKLFVSTINTNISNLHYVSDYDNDDIQTLELALSECNVADDNSTISGRRRLRLIHHHHHRIWHKIVHGIKRAVHYVVKAVSCITSAVGTGVACTAGEVGTDGADTILCVGGVILSANTCHEMGKEFRS